MNPNKFYYSCPFRAMASNTNLGEGQNSDHEEFCSSPVPGGNDDSGQRVFKSCTICKSVSGQFYINYGAPSCFSCRAFFRRALQKTKNPQFVCKYKGDCPVTVNERKCRKCRFDLCRKAGMKPELVLDEEQKKLRFRKHNKKKQGLEQDTSDDIENGCKLVRQKSSNEKRTKKRPSISKSASESSEHTSKNDDNVRQRVANEVESPIPKSQDIEPSPISQWTIPKSQDIEPSPKSQWTGAKVKNCTQANLQDNFLINNCDVKSPGAKTSERLIDDIGMVLGESQCAKELNEDIDIDNLESSLAPSSSCFSLQLNTKLQSYSNVQNNLDMVPQDNRSNQQLPCDLEKLSSELKEAWLLAHQRFHVDQDFYENIVAYHEGKISFLDVVLFKNHLISLAKLFADFALHQSHFKLLSFSDQGILIQKKAPLFVQLILGRYLRAPSGLMQLRWLLLNPSLVAHDYQNLQIKFPMGSWEMERAFFLSKEEFHLYLECVHQIQHVSSSFEALHLVGSAILLRKEESLTLENHQMIEFSKQIVDRLLNWTSGELTYLEMKTLLEVLDKMVQHFGFCFGLEDSSTERRKPNQSMLMPYTEEEEKWLKVQFQKFDAAFGEVSFGDELMHEFVMYSLGVPLSKGYIPKVMAGWVQRHKHIMTKQDEFNDLSIPEQRAFMRGSVYYAVSMSVCKLGSCDTGMEQVAFGAGHLDSCNFDEKFGAIIKQHKLQKVKLSDVNPYVKLLEPELVSEYYDLLGKLTPLVRDSDTYKLLTLITMFSDDNLKGRKSCSMVNRYLTLLRRRLHYQGKNDEAYERILVGLNDITKLSSINQKLLYCTTQMANKAKYAI